MGRTALIVLAGLGVSLATPAFAAETLRDLCPDRPTKGTGACTVDAGHWQVESDIVNYTFQRDAGVSTQTWLATSPTVKLGLTDKLDAELAFTPDVIVRTTDHSTGLSQTESGFGDTYARLKFQVASGPSFQAVVLPFVKAPTARTGIGDGAWEGGLILPLQWNLPKGWQLGFSPEADWMKNGSGSGYHLASSAPVTLSHEIAPKITGSVEVWTGSDYDPAGTTTQWSADAAVAWLVRPDVQLDAGVNFGLNRNTPATQAYVGVSRRF